MLDVRFHWSQVDDQFFDDLATDFHRQAKTLNLLRSALPGKHSGSVKSYD